MAETDRFESPFLEARHVALRGKAQRLSTTKLERLESASHDDLEGASRKSIRIMAEGGLLAHTVSKAVGGVSPAVEVRALAQAREGIAYGSGLADTLFALQGLGSLPLTLAGTDEQRRAWLPRVAKGTAIAGFAITEPEAGSDLLALRTTAKRVGDSWEITGTKRFISNAGIADFYTLFARTDPEAGTKGVSAFLLPGDARGLQVRPLQATAPHPLGSLELRKVRLPREALIGAEGTGLSTALRTLDLMRPTVAAAAVGMAWRALDEALARARARVQFGRPIGDNQGVRWKLAEAATDLEAARLLVQRAAWLKDSGRERITLEAAQAKLFATEAAQRIVDLAVQVHGGSGVLMGTVVERLYREVRALRIYEGTSEILRDVVAKGILPMSGDGARSGAGLKPRAR